jgi:hypothetical protein
MEALDCIELVLLVAPAPTLKPLPIRTNALRDTVDPQLRKSNMDTADPLRTNVRTDRDDEIVTKFCKEALFPTFNLPNIETPDPTLATARTLSELPRVRLSYADTLPPSLTKDLTDNDEAKVAYPTSEACKIDPTAVIP